MTVLEGNPKSPGDLGAPRKMQWLGDNVVVLTPVDKGQDCSGPLSQTPLRNGIGTPSPPHPASESRPIPGGLYPLETRETKLETQDRGLDSHRTAPKQHWNPCPKWLLIRRASKTKQGHFFSLKGVGRIKGKNNSQPKR